MTDQVSERRTALAFLLPGALAVTVLVFVPLVWVVWLSFRRAMPVFGVDRFAGLENFVHLFSDSRFWAAAGNTLYFAVVAVSIEVILGLAIALLIHQRFRGRGLVRAAVLIPWVIPTVVTARMWEWIYNPEFGLMNYLLRTVSLISGPVSWLGDPFWAIHAAILADVWKTTPFAALLLLAGLASIPPDLADAARVDGAGLWQVFTQITLPLLRPALLVTVLFRFLDSFRVFDAIYVLTGGGPANTTETLAIYTYKVLFQTMRFGYGSAIALSTFAMSGVASIVIVGLGSRSARATRSPDDAP
ncbi:MAG: sugar ABC transporter permease [Acidobacteriota bacterium]